MVNSATNGFAENLSHSVLNNQDPGTVKVAIPSYLLLLDAMIYDDPENADLLRSAAMLNGAFAGLFVEEKERQQIIIDKALDYATQSLCAQDSRACQLRAIDYDQFSVFVKEMNLDVLPAYYALATTWATWVQAYSDDWNAVAQLSRIELIMQRILVLDETYAHGGAHIYMGILATLLPPAMGGHPEVGRKHFERSIELSDGKNLMAKVIFAERYARLMFNRELHDRLLQETLSAEVRQEDLTLMNTIAKQKAKQLLVSAKDYF